ncbi:lauroyl-Kdo(2)-lipid IV(A) myristoyltransferase [Vibrio sp. 10N.261.55.A7]|uniref:lauroyl-Kdo(2)-lipid IV(A) myristoyltransferase n=1 Tax=Vibrio sp. 10N.261.55.A7 TaxID=1880851 RepID=UPI000C817590|nr:lauroyl-Kdo(2)-lipid IV(A) myristoyltransferase [Vibrio sp. 10N.261.55.A7]PMK05040.1 lipid A biosynthesis (KDO)2-(lauroyl)-lipid IVA acyltransferase [Vibrio sp. 10N.261.55.A7]
MTQERNDYDPKAYNPTFKREFLTPMHWGTWLGLLVGLPFTLLPNSIRVSLARFAAKKMCAKRKGSIQKARINLALCFPKKNEYEREVILEKCLTTAGAFLIGFPAISLRSKKWLKRNSSIVGLEHLQKLQEDNQNAILLVPHSWCIDIPAILLASTGLPVSAMANSQKNPLTDWLMHKQRVQYGGRVYDRSGGIKPFIKSVKDGYLGYYLPDQDHGPEQSVFVDFFGTEKATLPGLGKLAKVSRAKIVPTFASYNIDTGKYEIEIKAPIDDLSGDEYLDARVMNEVVEGFVRPKPEQYMWILKLLKTRRNGVDPYIGY